MLDDVPSLAHRTYLTAVSDGWSVPLLTDLLAAPSVPFLSADANTPGPTTLSRNSSAQATSSQATSLQAEPGPHFSQLPASRFRGLVVSPHRVAALASNTDATATAPRLIAVAGFPTGCHHSLVKAAEARLAVHEGAAEVWLPVDASLSNHNAYLTELVAIREACPDPVELGIIVYPSTPNTAVEAARLAGFNRAVLADATPADGEPREYLQQRAGALARLETVTWLLPSSAAPAASAAPAEAAAREDSVKLAASAAPAAVEAAVAARLDIGYDAVAVAVPAAGDR